MSIWSLPRSRAYYMYYVCSILQSIFLKQNFTSRTAVRDILTIPSVVSIKGTDQIDCRVYSSISSLRASSPIWANLRSGVCVCFFFFFQGRTRRETLRDDRERAWSQAIFGQAKRASRERASEGPPFRCPSRLRRSLARSRETRFTRPNRRACFQANISANQRQRVRSWPCGLHESEIQGKVDRRFSLPPRRESLSISWLKKVKKNRKD